MKFDNYKIRMNIKSCCLYEQLFDKNFLKINDADDLFEVLYCCVVVNNPSLVMTYEVFKTFSEDPKVSKWLRKEYEKIADFNSQIKGREKESEESGEEDVEELRLTDIAAALIVRHGVDAHYVMYEMDLWEIQPYLNQADIQRKADLVTQRFWTYLTIAPHIDGKKIRKPEDLVPFEWEKESRNKELDEVSTKAAFDFLTRNRKTKEEEVEE